MTGVAMLLALQCIAVTWILVRLAKSSRPGKKPADAKKGVLGPILLLIVVAWCIQRFIP